MENPYIIHTNILTDHECDLIVNSLEFQDLTNSYTNGRQNKYALVYPDSDQAKLLMPFIRTLDDMFPNLTIERFDDGRFNIMVFEYNKGDHFNKFHIDINRDPAKPNNNSLKRVKTVVMLLSAPESYSGGTFELKDVELDFSKRGSLIVFNSDHEHRVKPVTTGSRHCVIVWLVEK